MPQGVDLSNLHPTTEPEGEPEPFATECAFMVYMDPTTKHWVAESDLTKFVSLNRQREATHDDIFHGASMVLSDLQMLKTSQVTAQMVAQAQLQVSQQLAQKAQLDAIAHQVMSNKAHRPG